MSRDRAGDLAREYVLLGLRTNRLVDGFVDAYTGDPALARAVEAEPAPEPVALARQAGELLSAVPDSGLEPARARHLAGQLAALRTNLRRLAGERVGFVDEVDSYFQVRPTMGDEGGYAAAHAQLDRLLPGSGALPERLDAYRARLTCPPDRLAEVVAALSSALRDRTRAQFGLPPQETVEFQVVSDKPWSGFNYYRGGYRSDVAINADLPVRLSALPALVAHEAYPGHHTEHCRKEEGLVEREGRVEHTVFLVNTPECLVAEGLADLGLDVAVGAGWGRWAQEIYADLGLAFDGELAEAIDEASRPLGDVTQDAALLLHDRGADADTVVEHLRRWALQPVERARKALAFLTDPLWRAYTTTYVEGARLLRAWLAGRPVGQPLAGRYQRLLDEPLTAAVLQAELAA